MHLEAYKEVFCHLELRSSPKSIRADFLTFSFMCWLCWNMIGK